MSNTGIQAALALSTPVSRLRPYGPEPPAPCPDLDGLREVAVAHSSLWDVRPSGDAKVPYQARHRVRPGIEVQCSDLEMLDEILRTVVPPNRVRSYIQAGGSRA
ncbi:hypothetical protein FHX37_1047 [Haloactinospora alba]|uniref:Uncharacterized protein n=1 Tax=Haloactinospora alba TaxID=405555 RepID=A0A543NH22_9ACTN|nr:hypothetical protein [Haloactinospora alba]TQN31155.1 hypothetical protein FHX37_1047 [Haloactinospora alba]